MKEYLKACFSFSRRELNGMLVLLALLAALLAAQLLMDRFAPRPRVDFSAFEREAALLEAAGTFEADTFVGPGPGSARSGTPDGPHRSAAASADHYSSSGALNNQADRFPSTGTLKEPGGRSSSAAAVKKAGDRFSPAGKPEKTADAGRSRSAGMHRETPACPELEINTADSAAFLPLRGIGPVLSARIVKYRERLGGFHSVQQLLEVYGLDTAAFRRFRHCLRVDSSLIEKIDLNEADYRDLKRLPYWSPAQIRVVLNYRRQHGSFPAVSALYKIRALEERTIQKVMPYLMIE